MSTVRQHRPTIGVVVNPVAGVGGPAGLVGSDGAAVQREAYERGARPLAASRAAAALAVLAGAHPGLDVLTGGGALGEDVVRASGLRPRVVYEPEARGATTADDTARAVAAFVAAGAGLVLFAGGDGTARDAARGAGGGALDAAPVARPGRASRHPGRSEDVLRLLRRRARGCRLDRRGMAQRREAPDAGGGGSRPRRGRPACRPPRSTPVRARGRARRGRHGPRPARRRPRPARPTRCAARPPG